MITRINYQLLGLVAFVTLAFALFVGVQLLQPAVAEATANVSTSTVNLIMQKNISGPSPYTAVDFSFNVSGNGVNEHLTISDLGTGFYSSPLTLGAGTYTITEVGPIGSDLAEWTVLWAGECTEVTESTAQFVVNSGNMGDGDQYCSAENQYRPGVLKVEKKFVGTSTPPENFSFKVTQGQTTKFEGPFESDGNNSVNIGKGAYSVVETVSGSYTPSYSEGCSGTINNSQNITCTITNTWNGDGGGDEIPGCMDDSYDNYNPNATFDDGSCENDGGGNGTGTIVIEKQTLPNGNQTSFTFNPSWSATDFTLIDGARSTSTGLATGTYSVVETLPTNWTQTSAVCSDGSPITAILLQADETVTCVVTNTLDDGGGDNETPKWLVFGYVWHDKNSSDIWEKEQENPEDNEVDLDGWTVNITNGSATYSTTTDPSGYYYFYVPEGTWTISEVLQSQWDQTFPNNTTHVVVVGETTQAENTNFFAMVMDYLIPTAYAIALPTTYGPYDFGNVYNPTYSQGSYGGGGGYHQGSYGGGHSNGSGGGKKNDNDPIPKVLGDATSVVPVGAPNTGAGGAAPVVPTLPSLFAILTAANRMVRTSQKNG